MEYTELCKQLEKLIGKDMLFWPLEDALAEIAKYIAAHNKLFATVEHELGAGWNNKLVVTDVDKASGVINMQEGNSYCYVQWWEEAKKQLAEDLKEQADG